MTGLPDGGPLTAPLPPPGPSSLLCTDERCPECLHPAWAHTRVGDVRNAPRRCIGVDCTCRVLAR